jgi:hypothetical protein
VTDLCLQALLALLKIKIKIPKKCSVLQDKYQSSGPLALNHKIMFLIILSFINNSCFGRMAMEVELFVETFTMLCCKFGPN